MIKKIISALIIICLFGFLLFNIVKNWETINSFSWRWESINLIFLGLIILPMYFLNVLSWHLITKALGAKVSIKVNMRVWLLSNLSRFLPGSFWQYPGRIYLLKKEGVNLPIATTALIIEVLFNLLIGGIISAVALIFWQLPGNKGSFLVIILVIIFLIMTFFLNNTGLMTIVANFIKKKTGKGEILKQVRLPATKIPLICLVFLLQNLFGGSALFFVAKNAVDLPLNLLPSFVGIFTVSWLLGYIAIIAPSGLGVQEASITALLSAYMPFTVAAIVAILFRFALLLSELVNLLVMFISLKMLKTEIKR